MAISSQPLSRNDGERSQRGRAATALQPKPAVILSRRSAAKNLKLRGLRSFAVYAAQVRDRLKPVPTVGLIVAFAQCGDGLQPVPLREDDDGATSAASACSTSIRASTLTPSQRMAAIDASAAARSRS